MKALIAGAGIGGLSAAVALQNAGIECQIFETMTQPKPAGAAISIWPNGAKCFKYLGLEHILQQFGGEMRTMAYHDFQQGQPMTCFSLTPLFEQVQACVYPVSRTELQAALLEHWGADRVHFGQAVTHFQQDEKQVTLTLSDGHQFTGDILIAADGSRSRLRPHILGFHPERRYRGYVNWNGLVNQVDGLPPNTQWTTFVGEGKRVSLMPISGNRFYFFFDVPLPSGLAEDRNSVRQDLKKYFSGWAEPVQRLIDALDPMTTNRIEIHDIDPLPQLVNGRVALLGDAAHTTAPDIGQGASSALEDAVVLGECFRHCHSDPVKGLREYQQQRRQRVGDLVLKARKRSELTHGKDWQKTAHWYQQLKFENGDNIIRGLIKTIVEGPLG